MKKVLLLFALVAISVVSINAQDNLKWGVMAGMNVSKYTITGFDSRIGFHAGVKAEVGLSQDAKWQWRIYGFHCIADIERR